MFSHALLTPLVSFCSDRGAVRKRLAERFSWPVSDGRIATCHPKSVRVFASSSNRTDGWMDSKECAARRLNFTPLSLARQLQFARIRVPATITIRTYVELSVMGVFLITLCSSVRSVGERKWATQSPISHSIARVSNRMVNWLIFKGKLLLSCSYFRDEPRPENVKFN